MYRCYISHLYAIYSAVLPWGNNPAMHVPRRTRRSEYLCGYRYVFASRNLRREN